MSLNEGEKAYPIRVDRIWSTKEYVLYNMVSHFPIKISSFNKKIIIFSARSFYVKHKHIVISMKNL
jgi:hypothetical protein